MREYFIYAEVNYGLSCGSDRWVSFEKKIATNHALVVGMQFLIPGIWVSEIAGVQYDYASDEMGVYLKIRECDGDRADFDKLVRMFAALGWRIFEGQWDDEYLRAADEAESNAT